jgi:hypothetical protein
MPRPGYRTLWFLLLLIVLAAFVVVFIPVYLIQPFAPQTRRAVAVSYALRSWSPVVTVVLAIAAIAVAVLIWMRSKRWYAKAPLVLPLFLVFLFTWFARQNHFEWMFNPLDGAHFARAGEIDFLSDDEMVLAVKVNGEAVAYPVTLMGYHHIAQDVVGGIPITATY